MMITPHLTIFHSDCFYSCRAPQSNFSYISMWAKVSIRPGSTCPSLKYQILDALATSGVNSFFCFFEVCFVIIKSLIIKLQKYLLRHEEKLEINNCKNYSISKIIQYCLLPPYIPVSSIGIVISWLVPEQFRPWNIGLGASHFLDLVTWVVFSEEYSVHPDQAPSIGFLERKKNSTYL